MSKRIKITEQQLQYIVKNINRLDEQDQPTGVKRENLPTIPFNKVFLDNMVSVRQTPDLDTALQTLQKNIESAKKDKKSQLESISVTIDSGASDDRATNRLGAANQPDHAYGKRLPANQWMARGAANYDKTALSVNLNDLPDALKNYNINNGHLGIEGGNQWLANQRGLNLEKYLNSYLKDKYPEAKITITRNEANATSEKFVSATINGVTFKKTTIPTTNFYIEDNVIASKSGKLFIPASPNKVWGSKQLNTKGDFTLEKAQSLAKQNISDREILVIENSKRKGTQGETWYGVNEPYVEVKGYVQITKDPTIEKARRFWFNTYQEWLKEKNDLQKYKQAGVEESVDQAKTRGAAGWLGRVPAQPPYKKPDSQPSF